MSNPIVDPETPPTTPGEEEPAPGGINLALVYSLLGVALLAAILFACFIVWPFYLRR